MSKEPKISFNAKLKSIFSINSVQEVPEQSLSVNEPKWKQRRRNKNAFTEEDILEQVSQQPIKQGVQEGVSPQKEQLPNDFNISNADDVVEIPHSTISPKLRKYIILAGFLLLSGMIVGLLMGLSCSILNVNCPKQTSDLPPLIVSRSFSPSEVFIVNYTKSTLVGSGANSSHGTELDMIYYAVKETSIMQTTFVALFKKIYVSNGSYVQYFENQTSLQIPLLRDQSLLLPDLNDSSTINLTSINYTFNMFSFTLTREGNIVNITFINTIEKGIIGELPKYISMFSPLLSASLYPPPTRLLQTEWKVASHLPRILQTNTSNSSTSYNANKSSSSTSLQSNTSSATNSDTHNSNETSQSNSQFDKNGNLQSGTRIASSNLASSPNPPSSTYKTLDINVSLSVNQSMTLEVIAQYLVTPDNVTAFAYYLTVTPTLTMNESALNDYITGTPNSSSPARLLLPSQFSFINLDKEITFFRTNILGMQVSLVAYVIVFVGMEQVNDYNSSPLLESKAGLALNLGFAKFTFELFHQEKRFQLLSLAATLEAAQETMAAVKGPFLSSISALNVDSFYNSIPSLLTPITETESLIASITSEMNSLFPAESLDQILSVLTNISATVNLTVPSLFLPQNNVLSTLSNDIFTLTNSSYFAALQQFHLVQDLFVNITAQITFLFSNESISIPARLFPIQSNISSYLTNEITALYQAELLKAAPFFLYVSTFADVRTNLVTQLMDSHTAFLNSYNSMTQSIFNEFMGIALVSSDLIEAEVNARENSLSSSLDDSFKTLSVLPEQMNSTLLLRLKSYLDFSIWNYTPSAFEALWTAASYFANNTQILTHGCGSLGPYFWMNPLCCVNNDPNYVSVANAVAKQQMDFLTMMLNVNGTMGYSVGALAALYSVIESIVDNTSIPIESKFQRLVQECASTIGYPCLNCTQQVRDYLSIVITHQQQLTSLNENCIGYLQSIIYNSNYCEGIEKANAVTAYTGLITSLQNIILFMEGLNNFTEILDYNTMVNTFNNYNFYLVIQNSITNNIDAKQIYDEYKGYDGEMTAIIDTINGFYTTVMPLADTEKITDNLKALLSKMNFICSTNASREASVNNLRQAYANIYAIIPLNDSFLQPWLNVTSQQMNRLSGNAFQEFLMNDLCDPIHINVTANYTLLQSDFPTAFTTINGLLNDLISINSDSAKSLNSYSLRTDALIANQHRIYNQQMFLSYISSIDNLIQNYTDLIQNYSYYVSTIKLQTALLTTLTLTSLSIPNIDTILPIFTSLPFNLTAAIFNPLSPYKANAIVCLSLLNFDIFTIYIFLIQALDYTNATITNISYGSASLSASFQATSYNVLKLPDTVQQQYLNDIHDNISSITTSFNSTVFPSIHLYQEIQDWFFNATFHSPIFQQMYNQAQAQLAFFNSIALASKLTYYGNVSKLISHTLALLQTIKIGVLNSLSSLGVDNLNTFLEFYPALKKDTAAIPDINTLVLSDLLNALRINDLYGNVVSTVSLSYNKTILTILNRTTSVLKQIQAADLVFYSSLFPTLNDLKNLSNLLAFDFSQFTTIVKFQLDVIAQIITLLSPSAVNSIKTLSALKQQFISINDLLKSTRSTVVSLVQSIKDIFFLMENLLFTDMLSDIKIKLLPGIGSISSSLTQLAKAMTSLRPVAYPNLSPKVAAITRSYDSLSTKIGQFTSSALLSSAITRFSLSPLTKQVQYLQEAIAFITANNQPAPTQDINLFHYNIYNYTLPLASYSNYVLTQVGIFFVTFQIDFVVDVNLQVTLADARNIDLQVIFSIALTLDVNFGYSIMIIQIGIYLTGNIVKAQIGPGIQLYHLIPLQLVKSLHKVSSINQRNEVDLNFIITAQFFALQFEVGVFVGFLSFKIEILTINICIRLFFFSLCFSISFPFIVPYYIRFQWGTSFAAYASPKYTLCSLTMARLT